MHPALLSSVLQQVSRTVTATELGWWKRAQVSEDPTPTPITDHHKKQNCSVPMMISMTEMATRKIHFPKMYPVKGVIKFTYA